MAPPARRMQKNELRAPRRRRWPGSRSCRSNGLPQRRNCSRSSTPSRRRVKRLSWRKPRKPRPTDAVRQMARALEPVSVLISRKTQRLYVRRAFEPIFESPVTIRDADRPIGTHIFTAVERMNGETDMRWNVVSLESKRPHGGTVEPKSRARGKTRLAASSNRRTLSVQKTHSTGLSYPRKHWTVWGR